MAKITLNHAFETMSGKLCRKGSTYVALNKQTAKCTLLSIMLATLPTVRRYNK